jgi:hypothetical protein
MVLVRMARKQKREVAAARKRTLLISPRALCFPRHDHDVAGGVA